MRITAHVASNSLDLKVLGWRVEGSLFSVKIYPFDPFQML